MIEVVELTKKYGKKTVVDGLSFEVKPGIVTGFLGPNGAGKSTTMRLIIGLDNPQSGSVKINKQDFHNVKHPMKEIGVLLDADYMHPTRTAKNHLMAMAASNGFGKKRVAEVLELVGLSDVAKKRVGKFSLGMKQRVGLAGALLGDPSIIMLDEPANGLDPEGIRWIRQFLSHFASEGRTVFVSSHLLGEMAIMADELIVIGQGKLIAKTTVAEMTAQATGGYVSIKSPSISRFCEILKDANADFTKEENELRVLNMSSEELGALAFSNSIELHELANNMPSLEDAFLQITASSQEYKAKSIDEENK
jgi:ABC-2 type transport system ATP-binding protein